MRAVVSMVPILVGCYSGGSNWASQEPRPISNEAKSPETPVRDMPPMGRTDKMPKATAAEIDAANAACGKVQIAPGPSGCARAARGRYWLDLTYDNGNTESSIIELHPDGLAELSDPTIPGSTGDTENCSGCAYGRWNPNGNRIEFVINEYSCWVVPCGGNFDGESINVTGDGWRFVGKPH